MHKRRWRKGSPGQGLVEYSVMLLLVALAVFSTLFLLGPAIVGFIGLAVNSFPS